MNIETFRHYCLSKPGVREEFPFDQSTLVFKICNKIFCLTNIDDFGSFNVKCDPEEAVLLREKYPCIVPGYHMNKKHWNTVILDGSLPDLLLYSFIDHSYDLIFEGLTKKEKAIFES